MTEPTGSRISSAQWVDAPTADRQERLAETLASLAASPFLQRVASRSVELMGLRPGMRVLDVGCGTGVLLPALASAVGEDGTVIGVDYSAAMVEDARRRVEDAGLRDRVRLLVGDATSLPIETASVDAAHIERVLMHLDDPAIAIREMRRVVRPGGWVVAAEPDTGGIRVHHPSDPIAYRLIADRDVQTLRAPDIGLLLAPLFAASGLVDRIVDPLTEWDGTYDPIAAEGDRAAAAALVAEGLLDQARADAAIDALVEAAERGEYSWLCSMVIAAGRVPPDPPPPAG